MLKPYDYEFIFCCSAYLALTGIGLHYVFELAEALDEYMEYRKGAKRND